MLAGLPAPTRPGVSNNFDSLPRRQDYNDKFDIKVDQQINSATSAFVRFSNRDADNFEPPPIPGETSSPSNAYVNILNQQVAGGVTRTLGLTSLLEVRIGVSRTKAGKTALGTGSPNMFEAYGITGLPTDTVFAGGLTQQSVSGWTAWGRQSSNPQFQDPLVIDARLNYSWIRGRHTLKTGYEYQHINTDIDDVHPKYGADGYAGQFSRPTGAAADAATFNLVDFLVGARNTYELVNPFVFELRQRMHFGYVQDDWRVTPNLTFNLGLRYELGTPQWENSNYLTNFDPATNTLLQATDGSIYDRALVNPDTNNFAPRLGVAYSLTPKTVIRSAYGTSYIHFNRLGGENLLSFNGPHVVPLAITQQPSQGACAAGQAPTTCFRTTQQGYPEGLNVPANFNPLNGRVNYIPPDTNTGNVQNWHVTVQRELLSNLLVDVAYIGNRSRNLVILGDYNQARPNNAGEDVPLQTRRPIQGYQFIQAAFDGGKASYHALQVKVERRYTRGLYFLNSFTWSKAEDNASGHLETANGDNSRVNYRDIDGEWGTSGYNQPINNTTTVVWELPFGRDRRWANEPEPDPRGHRRRLAPDGHQHDDERPAGEPELLALVDVLGQRRADLPAEPRRRRLRRRLDRQLLQPRQRRHSDRPDAAVRQRAAKRRARPGDLHARSRAAQGLRPRTRRLAPRVPHRGVQRAQQDQLRRAERQPLVHRLRDDPHAVDAAAADSVGRESGFLIGALHVSASSQEVRRPGDKSSKILTI